MSTLRGVNVGLNLIFNRELIHRPFYLRRLARIERYCLRVLADETDDLFLKDVEEQLAEVRSLRREIVATNRIIAEFFFAVGGYALLKAILAVAVGWKSPICIGFDVTWALWQGREWLRARLASMGKIGTPERAATVFNLVSAVLPPRIAYEELGDALENIKQRAQDGRPGWEIELKVWMTVVWAVLHGVEDTVVRVVRIWKGLP